MKLAYEKPVFYAEEYSFNSSIAKCGQSIDEPLLIKKGDNVCGNGIDGHIMGGQNGKKGEISHLDSVFLFADGLDQDGCALDWDYEHNIILQTNKSFAATFYGNDASEKNHAPGYNGVAFLS